MTTCICQIQGDKNSESYSKFCASLSRQRRNVEKASGGIVCT